MRCIRIAILTARLGTLSPGELDLSGVQWQASKHFLLLALAYLKRMFYKPELWEVAKPFNLEAFRMCAIYMLFSV